MNQAYQNVTEHTGFPNPATDQTLTSLNLNDLLIKYPASTFFMTIDSHAWDRFGIFKDDLVIIDRSLAPKSSDLVIWWDTSNFCLGRFAGLDLDTPIWGVVTNIIHRYRI